MNAIDNFQVEDIDGCEFVRSIVAGKMMISFHQDFDGNYTGLIHVVYSDGSQKTIDAEEVQKNFNESIWKVHR